MIKQAIASEEPSEPSEPSAEKETEQQIPNSIYRLGHSDRWACKNCSVKGDKWFMLTHPEHCKTRNKNKSGGDKRTK